MAKTVLVTGAAGFIGHAVSQRLIERGDTVMGIDNLNDYYDVQLKNDRLALLSGQNFTFYKIDLADREAVSELFSTHTFDAVIHLAAQAGVRYSITHPHSYIDSNIVGFMNVLEACRHATTPHLIYASSSSVYGKNQEMPYSIEHNVDHPISLYAATKKSNELMAHTYSHLYHLPTTGLRFFTVYGPWGRPDMSPIKFAQKIAKGEPIDVYNFGDHQRDFTYIDDIVEGIVRLMDRGGLETSPYELHNIGNNKPVELMYFIELLENALGKPAIKNMLPMQAGDVKATYANIDSLQKAVGYQPVTQIEQGVQKFIAWFKSYYTL